MADADRLAAELRDRRVCLEGAKQTLVMVAETLRGADSLELARAYLETSLDERLELVDQAIASTDRALDEAG